MPVYVIVYYTDGLHLVVNCESATEADELVHRAMQQPDVRTAVSVLDVYAQLGPTPHATARAGRAG